MKVSTADKFFNRILKLCRGLHSGQDWGADKRGRRYRDCLVCGCREFVKQEETGKTLAPSDKTEIVQRI